MGRGGFPLKSVASGNGFPNRSAGLWIRKCFGIELTAPVCAESPTLCREIEPHSFECECRRIICIEGGNTVRNVWAWRVWLLSTRLDTSWSYCSATKKSTPTVPRKKQGLDKSYVLCPGQWGPQTPICIGRSKMPGHRNLCGYGQSTSGGLAASLVTCTSTSAHLAATSTSTAAAKLAVAARSAGKQRRRRRPLPKRRARRCRCRYRRRR